MKNTVFPHKFWRPFLDCMPQLVFRPQYVWFPVHLKGVLIPLWYETLVVNWQNWLFTLFHQSRFVLSPNPIGFSFSWLALCIGGRCLEWLAVGLSRFLIYLALSPHLIIWSCEAVCPYGSRVCHGLPNRLWVAWVSRFKCRYLDTQRWQSYCFLNNWHNTLSEAVGGKQILGVHLHNFANNSYGIQIFYEI